MFKKIRNLTYNELSKQYKKTSIKVITAIILILSILLPIGISFIEPKSVDYSKNQEFYVSQLEETVKKLEGDNTTLGKIKLAFAKSDLDANKIALEANLDYNDWRDEEKRYLESRMFELGAISLFETNINREEVLKNYHNVETEWLEKMAVASKATLQKEKEAITKDIEESKKIVLGKDYILYLNRAIARLETQQKNLEKNITDLEKKLAKDSKNEALPKQIYDEKERLENTKIEIKSKKYRLDNKIAYDPKIWQNKTLLKIDETHSDLQRKQMDEESFKLSGNNGTMSYEDYIVNDNNIKNNLRSNLNKYWYSLENNIPGLEFSNDARTSVNGLSDVFIVLSVILVIIIGGGIIAQEFSRGTIRLLMIRPVTRGKILFSKLLSLIVIGYGLVCLSIILLTVTSGIVYGFDTLSIPVLEPAGTNVVEVSYIAFMIKNILISSTSLLFIISLVFMISTLSKNTALAVAVGTVLYLGTLPLIMVLASLKLNWITQTFIPYINMQIMNLAPSVKDLLQVSYGMEFNTVLGATQLTIISIVMIVVTFIVFIKKDIRN